jgi:uncharacterized Zn finger protein (UPF0148 family)
VRIARQKLSATMMTKIVNEPTENIEDHMAYACQCGCVNFNLLKSGNIECTSCDVKIVKNIKWIEEKEQKKINSFRDTEIVESAETRVLAIDELLIIMKTLQKDMNTVGMTMAYLGGFGHMADRGEEMIGASDLLQEWINEIIVDLNERPQKS